MSINERNDKDGVKFRVIKNKKPVGKKKIKSDKQSSKKAREK